MEEESLNDQKEYKIVFLGDTGVGKTSITKAYTQGKFYEHLQSTIGAETASKDITVEDEKIKLIIWDTSGQERFSSLTSSYTRGAEGCFIVYDITQRPSFENIEKKIDLVKENAEENVIIILIGNKNDLEGERKVTEEEGLNFAKKHNCGFFETSAFTAKNIEEAFIRMAEQMYKTFKDKKDKEEKPKLVKIDEKVEDIKKEENERCCEFCIKNIFITRFEQ